MQPTFLTLPPELRIEVYKYLLVSEEPMEPIGGYENSGLWSNVLLTSSRIFHEARSILYENNCFEFSRGPFRLLTQFLYDIGPVNASYIKHIRVRFLEFFINTHKPDEIDITQGCAYAFLAMQNYCINLKTINLGASNWYFIATFKSGRLMPDNNVITEDIYEKCDKVLALAADLFRPITSLREIIIESRVENCDLHYHLRQQMQYHGWIVRLKGAIEEDSK